ncbi:hypothetical protein [Pannonibacter sp.]|uniref:hypothetical protein n=1 Tax=Pannonibacter sp. TaxID=1906786 RepID=UPI003F725FFF
MSAHIALFYEIGNFCPEARQKLPGLWFSAILPGNICLSVRQHANGMCRVASGSKWLEIAACRGLYPLDEADMCGQSL